MHIQPRLVIALFLLAVTSAPLLQAQFQEPTKEELQMTSDPAYPDASAIILDREVKADDLLHYDSEYDRIKVLTEKGKDLATVNLGYFSGNMTIEAVSGRTIHPDGTVVPLTVKPEDLLRVKEGQSAIHEVVFNLPSVEVGSILEYYYQVRFDPYHVSSPHWELQGNYPILKEHFFFAALPSYFDSQAGMQFGGQTVDEHGNLNSDLLWYTNLPPGKSLTPGATGHFDLALNDIPPLPSEQWMPPIESQRYQVIFYYTPFKSGTEYWRNEASYWLKDVDRFAEPTAAIKSAVAGIVAPGDSDIEKAKKLYAAVQALDNTDFSRAKSQVELKQLGIKPAKRAEDTWTQKSGSGQDIALLYLALLRGAGLTAYPMLVVNRDRGIFNPGYLNWYQLNDLVIILGSEGKDIVLDPAEKMCPFGMVHWKHSGAGGVRQSGKGVEPWVTPLLPFNANTTTRRGELTVGADGSVTGRLEIGFTGQEALLWRQQSLRLDEATLQQQFDEWLGHQVPSGVEAHFTHFSKLDDADSPLTAYATVTGSIGSVTEKRMFLPGSFFTNANDRAFIEQPHRQESVDMHYAVELKDGVLYHLPAGYTVEGMPQSTSIPWPSYAVFAIKTISAGNNVTVIRGLSRGFTLLSADEYGLLHDFYQKVATADQQQLVLSRGPVGKGN